MSSQDINSDCSLYNKKFITDSDVVDYTGVTKDSSCEQLSLNTSDSGMEDEPLNQSKEDSDNEDEVLIGRKTSRGKHRMILEDDDDGTEEHTEVGDLINSGSTKDTNLCQVDSDTLHTDDVEDDTLQTDNVEDETTTIIKKKKKKRFVAESDERDNDLDVPRVNMDLKNNDLFDAEISDDDRSVIPVRSEVDDDNGGDDAHSSESEENHGNEDDEGFDESQLNPEILAKLKKFKGASKSSKDRAKYARKSKPSADKMLEIYSDSQRMLRETRVNIPYYEPETRSLNDFLARASKKKQEYAGLRRAKDIVKAQIIQEKLALHLLPSPPAKHKSKATTSVHPDPHQTVHQSSQAKPAEDSGVASQDQATSLSDADPPLASSDLPPSQNLGDDDDDYLPDLVPTKSVISSQTVIANNPSDSREADVSATTDVSLGLSSVKLDTPALTTHEASEDQVLADFNLDSRLEETSNDHQAKTLSQRKDILSICTNNCYSKDSESAYHKKDSLSKSVERLSNDPSCKIQSNSDISSPVETQILQASCEQTQFDKLNYAENALHGSADTDSFIPTLQKDSSRDLFLSMSSTGNDNVSLQDIKSPCAEFSSTAQTVILDSASADICETKNTKDSHAPFRDSPRENQSIKASKRRSLLDKLQGLELPPLPHLSGSPHDVIYLEEPQNISPPKNPALLKLMDKYAEHSKPRTPRAAHKVNLSIISKEGEEGTKKELKLKSLTYQVQQEDEILTGDTPGSKLIKLKQQLDIGMKIKREEARQRRLELYALENEEGFEGEKEDEEEEEEEEMTESSVSSEDEEEEEVAMMFQNDNSDDEKDYNPLLDTEAREDSDEDDGGSCSDGEKETNVDEDSNDVHLHFDASEDEEEANKNDEEKAEEDDDDILLFSRKKRKSKVVQSDDEDDDENSALKDSSKKVDDKMVVGTDSLVSSDRDPLMSLWSNEATQREASHSSHQDKQKFRRENSQSPDLYASDVSQFTSAQHEHNDSSQSITNSPMLDKDGFIKMTQRPEYKISSLARETSFKLPSMESSESTQLTAGNIFRGMNSQNAIESSLPFTAGDIFKNLTTQASGGVRATSVEETNEDENSMDQSMERSFRSISKETTSQSSLTSQTDMKSSKKFQNLFDDDDGDIYDPFSVLSKNDDETKPPKHKRLKPVFSGSEEDENATNDSNGSRLVLTGSENEESEEEADREADTDLEEASSDSEVKPKFTGFKQKKKGIRGEFLEEEAELSGSEFDSDENLDLDEEDDILEEEEGDKEMAGVSEEMLREEVGRVHMKRLQDDDDKQVMFFKEMYLQDGDLYSEGGGRMRNFRWKDNADPNSQKDMFTQEYDDEQAEDDAEDLRWRKDRYEREKFLEEAESEQSEENSQLLKLGSVYLKKRESSTTSRESLPTAKDKMLPPESPKFKLPKKGSFLSRKDDTLIKIAQVTKSAGGTGRNSRNFIFQSVDQQELHGEDVNDNTHSTVPPKRKAHSATQIEQAAKKPKLSETTSNRPLVKRRDSIFNLLD